MTLRVEDLKPGDVVRMDLVVKVSNDRAAQLTIADGDYVVAANADLAAGNAELVVRPRPVRNGDKVQVQTHPGKIDQAHYIGPSVIGSHVVYNEAWRQPYEGYQARCLTHADGTPIDWEESE